jgi:deoxyguanosine kinase
MPQNKVKIITVIGNIGGGKSTLTKHLAHKLKAKLVKADNLYLINPFFPLAVKDRKRWSLASDLWFLKERVKVISKELKTDTQFVVIDSGIPMSWIYSNSRIKSGHYAKEEWELYQNYYNLLTKIIPPSDILIELTAPSNQLMQRIKKRGREFEKKHFNIPYLESITTSLNEYKKQVLAPTTKLITLNTQMVDLRKPEHLQALIRSILLK